MAKTTITVKNGLFKPEIMSKELLRNLDPESVWMDCVNKDYEGEIKNVGDTVKINQPGNITVKTYIKGTPMVYESPQGLQDQLVIDQQKYFAFDIEDIDEVQANVTLVDKYFSRSRTAITLVKDSYIATKVWNGIDSGNIITAPAGGLDKDNIYGEFVKLRSALRWTNAIKQNGRGYDGKQPYAVVDPDVMGIILQTDQFTHATQAGDDTIRKGTVIRFAGFDIKESTNVTIDTTTPTHKIIAGTTEGFTYADQIAKTRTLEDKDDFVAHCAGLYLFGGLAAQPKALAGIEAALA
jgi:hypothetical protein